MEVGTRLQKKVISSDYVCHNYMGFNLHHVVLLQAICLVQNHEFYHDHFVIISQPHSSSDYGAALGYLFVGLLQFPSTFPVFDYVAVLIAAGP